MHITSSIVDPYIGLLAPPFSAAAGEDEGVLAFGGLQGSELGSEFLAEALAAARGLEAGRGRLRPAAMSLATMMPSSSAELLPGRGRADESDPKTGSPPAADADADAEAEEDAACTCSKSKFNAET